MLNNFFVAGSRYRTDCGRGSTLLHTKPTFRNRSKTYGAPCIWGNVYFVEFWKLVYCHRIKLYQNASLCSNFRSNIIAPLANQEDLEEEEKHSLELTKEQTSLNTKPSALATTSALAAASVASVASTSSTPQLSVSTQWLSRPAIE